MVPLVLPALLVFSHLAPDAGRSTAFGIVASLPLPHSPAALCLRPIIPLPDLIFVLFSELAAARSASDSRASDSDSRLDSRSLSPAASSTFARRFASTASASCALPETPWHSCLELPDLGREVVQALLLLLHLLQGA